MSRIRSFTLDLNPPSDFGPLRTQHEETVKKILTESDRMAKRANVNSKEQMHIVLLAEEMISVLPHLMQYGSGKFWIEGTDDAFEMHIMVTPKSGAETKASAGRKANDASGRTIMSRVLDVFDRFSRKGSHDGEAEIESWSLESYIEKLKQEGRESRPDEWDELEHSILANLADDVIVRNVNGDVDLVIKKKVTPQPFNF